MSEWVSLFHGHWGFKSCVCHSICMQGDFSCINILAGCLHMFRAMTRAGSQALFNNLDHDVCCAHVTPQGPALPPVCAPGAGGPA